MDPLQPEDPPAVGPYRLLGRLGEGGQGVVYLGEAPGGQQVAVKVLLDGYTGDHRFAKEVEAARRVEPFCIAQVLDASLGGRPYIVTEYVEGPALNQAGRHAGADLQRLAVATATALAAIHRAGVVHRDFKPANVLLGRDGPRVIDFGIARAMGHSLTVTSSIVGTPSYMAPEQLAGEPVGSATDVFAWAAVMVFAATGTPPFGNDSLPAVIRRILHDEPYLGDLPGALCPIVLACLAKNPAARPSMQDVLLWLIGARPAPPPPPPSPPPQSGPFPQSGPPPQSGPFPQSGPPLQSGPFPQSGPAMPSAQPMASSPFPQSGPAPSPVATRPPRRGKGTAALMGVGALAVSGALVAGAITLMPQTTTSAAPPPVRTPEPTTPGTAGKKPSSTATSHPKKTTTPRRQPTPKATTPKQTPTQTAAPTTAAPKATKTSGGANVRLVSVTLDGMKTGDCYQPSTFPVARLAGSSGKQIEYGYRWIVDGQDEGWLTGFLTNGSDLLRRNPMGAFPAGKHTIVFRLLTHAKATRTLSFTICEL
ncbi:serine/threonine-protein kinase [Nonomuraea insulae]|uniref:non-specific serine/threonine protein kinase n=1 Tax=Nonomuraea insulae TaxID=1616787 RepID=A0ABW1CNA5_9ACTN